MSPFVTRLEHPMKLAVNSEQAKGSHSSLQSIIQLQNLLLHYTKSNVCTRLVPEVYLEVGTYISCSSRLYPAQYYHACIKTPQRTAVPTLKNQAAPWTSITRGASIEDNGQMT